MLCVKVSSIRSASAITADVSPSYRISGAGLDGRVIGVSGVEFSGRVIGFRGWSSVVGL